MSLTTRCRPWSEPGGHRADARPDRDGAGRSGRHELDDAEVRPGAGVDEQFEAGLLDVEGLGAIDVADRDDDEFEGLVHGAVPPSGVGSGDAPVLEV